MIKGSLIQAAFLLLQKRQPNEPATKNLVIPKVETENVLRS
jgi:hypothetical protein